MRLGSDNKKMQQCMHKMPWMIQLLFLYPSLLCEELINGNGELNCTFTSALAMPHDEVELPFCNLMTI
jgi:hypothetical protein